MGLLGDKEEGGGLILHRQVSVHGLARRGIQWHRAILVALAPDLQIATAFVQHHMLAPQRTNLISRYELCRQSAALADVMHRLIY